MRKLPRKTAKRKEMTRKNRTASRTATMPKTKSRRRRELARMMEPVRFVYVSVNISTAALRTLLRDRWCLTPYFVALSTCWSRNGGQDRPAYKIRVNFSLQLFRVWLVGNTSKDGHRRVTNRFKYCKWVVVLPYFKERGECEKEKNSWSDD